ncbi:hypothetical protein [Kitasatospora viridis]|uniref:Uncharacterized protein n=1 Tax=Kitasatospora viridis TaxID=281105 RepID=A0A561S9W3_9ACTN|nr:hypothetical protein [Kitasatospora viridis]TWF71673.1 hypothetical protein FHX73_1844 [Kitasatospora viridis]
MADEGMTQDAGVGALDPFGGNSQMVTWTSPINLGQFQHELRDALGDAVQLAVYVPREAPVGNLPGAEIPVDADHPLTLFVSPSSVDPTQLRSLLAAHRPDPYYGASAEERLVIQVRQKVAAGQELTPEELTLALKVLMRA